MRSASTFLGTSFIVSCAFAMAACTQAKFESVNGNLAALDTTNGDGAAGTLTTQPGGGDGVGSIQQPTLQQCEQNGNFTSSPNSAGRTIAYQSNNSNYSSVVQVGSNNFAQVTQTGTSNVSCIYQSGAGNSVTVNQSNQGAGGGTNTAVTNQISGGTQAPIDGETCLCSLLSYCQQDASASICQSLE